MGELTRNERRLMYAENLKWPETLRLVDRKDWPFNRPPSLIEVWRSRDFLVQVHDCRPMLRLSICRSHHNGASWFDKITWDELMQLKRECGRGDRDALEVYPADRDVVNVANMRHLWLPPEPVPWAWRK